MKVVYSAVTAAILLLGLAGTLFWNDYRGSRLIESSPQGAVSKIKEKFQSLNQPAFVLNVEELRRSREFPELIDPAAALPHTQKYNYKRMSRLYRYATTCGKVPKGMGGGDLEKVLIWHEYICGYRKVLPKKFFETKPMMHPSGLSFVKLAHELFPGKFNSAWVASNRKFTHITENTCGAEQHCIDGLPLKYLSGSVKDENLKSIISGETLVETPLYILISTAPGPQNFVVNYLAYDRKVWNEFLNKQFLNTQGKLSPTCLLQEGTVCWSKNLKRSEKESLHLALLFTMGLGVLAGTMLMQIIRRNLLQKRTARQRTFVFQMLTHEVRTPATALTLSLETLRRDFDKLPIDSQKAFLNICDQTQKLTQVIEASKQYLIHDTTSSAVRFKTQQITSLNSYFETIFEKFGDKIIFEKLALDTKANFDRYWIELCLNNLIENALSHGEPPVVITLSFQNGALNIQVRDQGQLEAQSIDELAVPFKKGASSRGLGLGLVLVKKIVQAMDGELTLSCAPTTFSVKLRNLL